LLDTTLRVRKKNAGPVLCADIIEVLHPAIQYRQNISTTPA
jgi:hypothetical protein